MAINKFKSAASGEPVKARLFTGAEIEAHLEQCHAYSVAEFGEEYCISIDRIRRYRQAGVHFYQPYGNPEAVPISVHGIAHCVLISHQELDLLKQKKRTETELEPWKPADGSAVFWVAGIVSDVPGIAAKCLSGIFGQIEANPYKYKIDTASMICTGPQGYLMSQAFDMKDTNQRYQEGWMFMERRWQAGELDGVGKSLQAIWTMTKAKDAIRQGRERWGSNWRNQPLLASGKT